MENNKLENAEKTRATAEEISAILNEIPDSMKETVYGIIIGCKLCAEARKPAADGKSA